jgi:hypothetical protein
MRKKFSFLPLLLIVGLVFTLSSRGQTNPVSKWESEISDFERADKTNPPPTHGILFVGSSSIRKWTTLSRDFPGLPVFNRGFGGSEIADSTALADRIIIPYRPRLIVFYAGDNDLAAGKSASQVVSDFRSFLARVHAGLPETRVIFLSIKPSPSRWKLKDKIETANFQISAIHDPLLTFVNIYPQMLDAEGKPRPELFLSDMLHMNEKGYAIWITALRSHLK